MISKHRIGALLNFLSTDHLSDCVIIISDFEGPEAIIAGIYWFYWVFSTTRSANQSGYTRQISFSYKLKRAGGFSLTTLLVIINPVEVQATMLAMAPYGVKERSHAMMIYTTYLHLIRLL
ncbi:MAG: hypothetical protein DK304_000755 [Chloroflexi bacterium]|jgi:hypothetical protein|nr:MAG: hypothetical protein DK304_000755 [Chloroflexota bacterium]